MVDVPDNYKLIALVISLMAVLTVGDADYQEALTDELDRLVTSTEKELLFHELARIEPPDRIRELAGFNQRQLDLGGGCCRQSGDTADESPEVTKAGPCEETRSDEKPATGSSDYVDRIGAGPGLHRLGSEGSGARLLARFIDR